MCAYMLCMISPGIKHLFCGWQMAQEVGTSYSVHARWLELCHATETGFGSKQDLKPKPKTKSSKATKPERVESSCRSVHVSFAPLVNYNTYILWMQDSLWVIFCAWRAIEAVSCARNMVETQRRPQTKNCLKLMPWPERMPGIVNFAF